MAGNGGIRASERWVMMCGTVRGKASGSGGYGAGDGGEGGNLAAGLVRLVKARAVIIFAGSRK